VIGGWQNHFWNRNQAPGQVCGRLPQGSLKGESRLWDKSRKTAVRQLRRRSGLGKPANQMSGFLLGELYSSERRERVKIHEISQMTGLGCKEHALRANFKKYDRHSML